MDQLWAAAAQDDLANHTQAVDILSRLWEPIHTTTTVEFFEEAEQDIILKSGLVLAGVKILNEKGSFLKKWHPILC